MKTEHGCALLSKTTLTVYHWDRREQILYVNSSALGVAQAVPVLKMYDTMLEVVMVRILELAGSDYCYSNTCTVEPCF